MTENSENGVAEDPVEVLVHSRVDRRTGFAALDAPRYDADGHPTVVRQKVQQRTSGVTLRSAEGEKSDNEACVKIRTYLA